MNARTKNVSIAKETLQIIKDKQYTNLNGKVIDLSNALDFSISNTIYYPAEYTTYNIPTTKVSINKNPIIEVTNETTACAAVRLGLEGKKDIAALNFASARNVGGGFLAGALAQEEDLTRCSGLYACIRSKPMFYNTNILCDNSYYTDGIVYSPQVPFFRNEHNLFLEEPYNLSIISAPAPNVSSMEEVDEEKLIDTLFYRVKKILNIAVENGHKNIILGAWGCGAFGNDPIIVSEVFMTGLKDLPYFEHVCFAVYDTSPEQIKYNTFKDGLSINR
jgi:uncharacterized protein (TIGR02452 family)